MEMQDTPPLPPALRGGIQLNTTERRMPKRQGTAAAAWCMKRLSQRQLRQRAGIESIKLTCRLDEVSYNTDLVHIDYSPFNTLLFTITTETSDAFSLSIL